MIVNARTGQLEIPGEEDLISRSLLTYGEWAQQELDMLANFIHRGDSVVDAGAFIGTHSRAFAEFVGPNGHVHAFEPNSRSLPFLEGNAKSSGYSNITVHGFGLGETAKTEGFVVENNNLGASHRVSDTESKPGGSITIQRLDDIGLDRINFIKADVEGMEISLLKGAQTLIEKCRPVIYLELNSLEMGAESLAWARLNSYRVHGFAADPFNPNNYNQQFENIFGDAMELGLILTPHERQSEYFEAIQRLKLPPIISYDDIALLLLHKPQYTSQLLAHSRLYQRQLAEIRQQLEQAEKLAWQRFEEMQAITRQLALTDQAKEQTEKLALQRFEELEAITRQLALTDQAKDRAERLAFQRFEELEAITRQLALTDQAKDYAEKLAWQYLEERNNLQQKITKYEDTGV